MSIPDEIDRLLAEKQTADLEQLGRAQMMRDRCLLQGCYYGLATQSDACVYCGTSRPAAALGVSPIQSAIKALDR